MSGKLNCHNLFYGKTRMRNHKETTFSINSDFQQNSFTTLSYLILLKGNRIFLKVNIPILSDFWVVYNFGILFIFGVLCVIYNCWMYQFFGPSLCCLYFWLVYNFQLVFIYSLFSISELSSLRFDMCYISTSGVWNTPLYCPYCSAWS